MTARLRATLRLAFRLVRAAPGRSALIVTLVSLPVLAGVFVSVTVSTYRLSPQQSTTRTMGQADALVQVGMNGGPGPAPASYDVAAHLPPGARAIPDEWSVSVRASHGSRALIADGVVLDLADPLTRGMSSVRSGHAPHRPGEVAVSAPLAARLHLHVGSRFVISTHRTPVTVSAVVRDPSSLSREEIVTADVATFGGRTAFETQGAAFGWLVSLPTSASASAPAGLPENVTWTSRHDVEYPPAWRVSARTDPQVVAAVGAAVFFALLEVVLLAGTAFAVGARRQVHDLALVRVAGGDDGDVRAVVVAQAVVLGLVAAAVGTALGLAAVFFGRPLLEHFVDRAFGPYDVLPLQVVGVIAIGVVASTLAAVVPARAASRLPVVAMLRRRFPVDTAAPHTPAWARVGLVAGPVITAAAALGWHHARVAYAHVFLRWVRQAAVAPTPMPAAPHDTRWSLLLILGATVTLAGLVRTCPELFARLGRASGAAPLSLRLALRDGARHRHRTAPATAAVMTVLAGAVLLAYIVSSTQVRERRQYEPSTPVGDVTVQMDSGGATAPTADSTTATATRRAAQVLGASRFTVFATLQTASPDGHAEDTGPLSLRGGCDGPVTITDGGSAATECTGGQVAAGDAGAVDLVAGRHVPGAAAALAAGKIVVFQRHSVAHGVATLSSEPGAPPTPGTAQAPAQLIRLPALEAVAPGYPMFPVAMVSGDTARAHGWVTISPTGVIVPRHVPSHAQQDRLNHALGSHGLLLVERGYEPRYGIVLLALIAATGLVTVAGTSIAVALSMSESRVDMATLAAVGASPSRRRRQAMAQAATIGVIGSVLGLLLGSLVGLGVLGGSTSYPLTIPLRWLAVVVVTAPTLAVLVAGAFTRGRLPLDRRIA